MSAQVRSSIGYVKLPTMVSCIVLGIISLLCLVLQAYLPTLGPSWREAKETILRVRAVGIDGGKLHPRWTNEIPIEDLQNAYMTAKSVDPNQAYLLVSGASAGDDVKWDIKRTSTTPGFATGLFCVGVTVIFGTTGVRFWHKAQDIRARSELTRQVRHLKREHRWLQDYGLARLHSARMPHLHYFDALTLITKGFEALCEDPATRIPDDVVVTLFFPGSMNGINELLTEDPNCAELKRLYGFWNGLAKEGRYRIRRVFICSREVFSEGDDVREWYQEQFPDIDPIHVDTETPDIQEVIKELGDDLDFAVFQSGPRTLCAGFVEDHLTYVLLGEDKLGPRGHLVKFVDGLLKG